VWDPIWRGYDPEGPDNQPLFASLPEERRDRSRRWVHTAWDVHQKGIDIYARWIARCRKTGISPWLSMRMNDLHDVNDERCFMHSEFWRNHPELRRVPYRFADWRDRAFDYGCAEVRDYHMRLVKELLERYDPDGLELDWMRFGFHFKPGCEAEGSSLLTEFTRAARCLVREAEQRRGHRIALAARVPARPETALGLGMDAIRWAREGLIDRITPTPFWASVDTAIPLDFWKDILAGTKTELAPGLEVIIRSHPGMRPMMNSLETIRGTAAAYLERGVDRLYLFNHMDSETTIARAVDYPQLLGEVGSLSTLRGTTRRHVVTFTDTWAPGEPRASLLPASLAPDTWGAFRLMAGPAPGEGEESYVILFAEPKPGNARVLVNGTACVPAEGVSPGDPKPDLPVAAFRIPAGAQKAGPNLIELSCGQALDIEWVELLVTTRAAV
jgi:hypothetical protein